MSIDVTNNKTIAKNTVVLYIRTLVSMLISFVTSRLVLKYLGVDDYGVYNVVGGVVLLFSALSATLTGVTQRYITFAIGKGDDFYLKKVFSASIKIHVILGIIVFILLETCGLWYINNVIKLPEGRLGPAHFIFQTTMLSFVVDIVTLPYNSAVIAYEKFGFYAITSMAQSTLKLLLVCTVLKYSVEALIIYALIDLLSQLFSKAAFILFAHCKFSNCRVVRFEDRALYKEMLGFSVWNFLGTSSSVVYSHGGNLMINSFFGVSLNAAFGLTNQVQSAITSFVSNFAMAVNPQITKSYAIKDYSRTIELVSLGSKISSYLLLFFCTPVIINLDYLLGIWLVEVPKYTSVFIYASLLAAYFAAFNNPLNCLMFATGDIKLYQIVCVAVNILSLLALWVAYSLGAHPVVIFFLLTAQSIIKQIVMLIMAKQKISLNIKSYISKIYFKGLAFLCLPLALYLLKQLYTGQMKFYIFLADSIVSLLAVGVIIFFSGLDKYERQAIINFTKNRFR